MHLLQRMLAFDPERRISAEEALTHEYFAPLGNASLEDLGALSPVPSPRAQCALGRLLCNAAQEQPLTL